MAPGGADLSGSAPLVIMAYTPQDSFSCAIYKKIMGKIKKISEKIL